MTGILGVALVVPVLAYLLFVEFVARQDERRYQTDIHGDNDPALFSVRSCETRTSAVTANTEQSAAWTGWREMIVEDVQDESPDCRSFLLGPADGEPLPRFLGGQFIQVRSRPANGSKSVSRCYSLSSGPGQSRYRITVKRVPDGKMSGWLHESVSVGDVLEIKSPSGRFHLNVDDTERPLTLIAAGIGITPMLSMLLHSLEISPARSVHLFYQLRDPGNAPFLGPLRYLHRLSDDQASGAFRLHLWFSGGDHADFDSVDSRGRITAEDVISRVGADIDGDFRICGPNEFMAKMAEGLVAQGADEASVQFESFGGAAGGVGAISVTNGDEVAQHSVQFSASGIIADWQSDSGSLLDLAEEAGVSVDSGCRSGQCGSCIHRLRQGQVDYFEEPGCEVGADEVVLCVARPSEDVEIDA